MQMNVIITGASQGIGRGIATVLAAKGCGLGLLARNAAALGELQHTIQGMNTPCHIATCDIRDHAAVQDAVAALTASLGQVHGLINNAGLVLRKDILSISMDEWHALVETNLNGLFYATRAILPAMQAQGAGHIINISSISGRVPLPGGSAYAATKFAVTGLGQSMFQELRGYGIKVTTVYPGSVDSASHRHDAAADHSWKVTPEEVGEACWDVLHTRAGNCISELEIRPLRRPPTGG